jgi:hypothetical protein
LAVKEPTQSIQCARSYEARVVVGQPYQSALAYSCGLLYHVVCYPTTRLAALDRYHLTQPTLDQIRLGNTFLLPLTEVSISAYGGLDKWHSLRYYIS